MPIVNGLLIMPTRPLRRLRTSHKVWTQLVDEIDKKASDIVTKVISTKETIRNLVSTKLSLLLAFGSDPQTYRIYDESILGFPRNSIARSPAAGIDSSRTKPIRLGYMYYSAVSSAVVMYRNGKGSQPEELIYAHPAEAPDTADVSYAKAELTLEMFREEVKALKEFVEISKDISGMIVFLDGPIVDPPRFTAVDKLEERYRGYVAQRARLIRELLENGNIVIGVVKRVTGTLFVDTLVGMDQGFATLKKYGVGDYGLVLYASTIIRDLLKKINNGTNSDYVLAFKPFPLPDDSTDVKFYKEEGLQVYTFLMIPRLYGRQQESRPLRVEIAVSPDANLDSTVKKAAAAITEWLVPGTNIPEPVLVAHHRCNIRKIEASKMLKELATRSLYATAARISSEEAVTLLELLD